MEGIWRAEIGRRKRDVVRALNRILPGPREFVGRIC
jgi:hypothetical protein